MNFLKKANCIHNHNIQLYNVGIFIGIFGIWYLEWV